MNSAQMLRNALAKLKENGWVQHAYERDGKYCAIGALDAAYGESLSDGDSSFDDYWNARNLLDRAANEVSAGATTGVIGFNDTFGRTFAEVRLVFQAAIRSAKEA